MNTDAASRSRARASKSPRCSVRSISRAASRRANSRRRHRRSLRRGDCGARGRSRRVHASRHRGARAHARKDAERLRARRCAGSPVGLKDIYDTADMPTEYGSAAYKGHRPASDASPVTMLRRAGGVDPRQDRDHRIRASADRQDAQSAQSRTHAGRLVLRLRRRGRRRHGADRDRLADRRAR